MVTCADCGVQIDPRSERCRKCHGARERQQALDDSALTDHYVLDMVSGGMTTTRVARVLGVSRVQAFRRIRAARRRDGLRECT